MSDELYAYFLDGPKAGVVWKVTKLLTEFKIPTQLKPFPLTSNPSLQELKDCEVTILTYYRQPPYTGQTGLYKLTQPDITIGDMKRLWNLLDLGGPDAPD